MRRPAARLAVLALFACAAIAQAEAQTLAPPDAAQPSLGLSFDAALARLDDASPGLSGEDHAVRASELIADATRSLRRPVVSASASVIAYQKTLSVDLTGAKDNAATGAADFLSQLPGNFPVGLQQIVGQVVQRVGGALPTIFGAIPDTLQSGRVCRAAGCRKGCDAERGMRFGRCRFDIFRRLSPPLVCHHRWGMPRRRLWRACCSVGNGAGDRL